jgi:hypothetical protein
MTKVGKILVFINLVFSLAVGWLIIQVYTASSNWHEGYKKRDADYQVADASAKAATADKQALLNEKMKFENPLAALAGIKDGDSAEEKERKVRQALETMRTDLAAKVAELDKANLDLRKEKEKTVKSDAIIEASKAEVASRQADVEKMRATLVAEVQKNIDLVKEASKDRDRATAAELEAKSFRDRNARLEGQLQEMAKDLARVKANLGATAAQGNRGGKNPPAENVQGRVKVVDNSGLIKLSIGSDATLQRGHTLEVFRLGNTPADAKYLGTLRIIEVSPTEAVAQPMGKLNDQLRPGDIVASRILGG